MSDQISPRIKLNFNDLSNDSFEYEVLEPRVHFALINGENFDIEEVPEQDKENSPQKKKPKKGSVNHNKKPQFKFNVQNDIRLLEEVIAQNPFGAGADAWARVAEKLKCYFDITARRCRERTILLLSTYESEDSQNLKKSGTEEEYTQRDQLLQELKELREEAVAADVAQASAGCSVSKKQKAEEANAKGIELRKAALISRNTPNGSNDEISPDLTGHSKKLRKDIFQHIRDKGLQDNELKKRELELRERELDLKERELLLKERREEAEGKHREEMRVLEKKEKIMFLELFQKMAEKFQ